MLLLIGNNQTLEESELEFLRGLCRGPFYFLIYINDLTEGIKSNIKLFADDTSLSIEVDDPTQGAEVLNRDLEKVKD